MRIVSKWKYSLNYKVKYSLGYKVKLTNAKNIRINQFHTVCEIGGVHSMLWMSTDSCPHSL